MFALSKAKRMPTLQPLPTLSISSRRNPERISLPHLPPRKVTHLAIHTADGIQVLRIEEILRAEADGNYCTLHCIGGRRIVISRTLKAVVDQLPAHDFVRIHQSHAIRASEISIIRRDEVILANGDPLPLSRHQRGALLDHIQSFTAKI